METPVEIAICMYLLVHDSSKTSLALHDGVRNTHLAAESGQEDDELDRVDIVRDQHQRSLLSLDESDDVVETVLDGVRLLAHVLLLLALGDGGGLLVQTLFLLRLRLGSVLVEGVGELGDGWRDFETHVENLALALETDVLGPFHHAREVATGLDVLADTEVAAALLDKRVLQRSVRCASCDNRDTGSTHLFLLLARAGFPLRERRRSDLLACFGRLSLRRTVSQLFIL